MIGNVDVTGDVLITPSARTVSSIFPVTCQIPLPPIASLYQAFP